MQTLKLAVPLALALLLAGCVVPSVHPFYTEETLIFDPGLLGIWADKDGERWIFLASGEAGYELVTNPKGKHAPASFDARLVQIGQQRYLDLCPKQVEGEPGFRDWHMIPAHSIARVRLNGDTLEMSTLSLEWLRDRIDERQLQIAHSRLGKDSVLLTAPPAQLQAMVMLVADDAKAFPEGGRSAASREEPAPKPH